MGLAKSRYERAYAAHDARFLIPFPRGKAEFSQIREERIAGGASPDDPLAGVDLGELASLRAIERGRCIAATRAACSGCHGKDFGGADLLDMLMPGHWAAPNLSDRELPTSSPACAACRRAPAV